VHLNEICKQIIEAPRGSAMPDRDDLALLLKEAADLFMKERNLVKLSGRAIFVGDLHGDLNSASSAFGLASEKKAQVVFLGDIVDRGSSQLETINMILARKMLEPDKVHVLRGNHEFKEVNTRYGFADEVMKKYDQTIYWLYNVCFSTLPLAALLNGRVFAIHGGVCERIKTLADIEKLERSSIG
jgi:serine/threonine-protein phosphatase PP1 catalytic subunit